MRIDPNKKIQRIRTEDEMRYALAALISGKHTLHIPPQVEDADMVFFDVIEELLEARKKLAQPIPVISTKDIDFEALSKEIESGEPCVIMGSPGDTLQDIEDLRESVNATPAIPLNPVKTPIHDILKASAITTSEKANEAANAELTQYEALPVSSFLHQIPINISEEDNA